MSENINSVIKAFQVLELFDRKHTSFGITEIRAELGFPLSTTHRIVSTLQECGYLRQDPATSKYQLGIKSYILGTSVEVIQEMKHISKKYLKELSEHFNESVHLAVLDNYKILCIEKINSSRTLTSTPQEGETNHAYVTSVGKCILAHQPEEVVDDYLSQIELRKLTDKTITTKEAFKEELRKIRECGYAIDDEESEIGLTCFGAPVFNSEKKCIAAISVSVPTVRVDSMEKYYTAVQNIARKLSYEF